MSALVIRFIDTPGFVSSAITWVTSSLWDHTEALSRDGKSWIGAHAGTGVQARPLDWCKPTREARYAIPVPDVDWNKAHTWLESKIGTPYDYKDIVGILLKRRIWSGNRVICSALMTQFMQQAGLEPLNILPEYDALVTPETLHLSPLFIGRGIPTH